MPSLKQSNQPRQQIASTDLTVPSMKWNLTYQLTLTINRPKELRMLSTSQWDHCGIPHHPNACSKVLISRTGELAFGPSLNTQNLSCPKTSEQVSLPWMLFPHISIAGSCSSRTSSSELPAGSLSNSALGVISYSDVTLSPQIFSPFEAQPADMLLLQWASL